MTKITALASLAASGLKHDDQLVVVDVHDTTMAASGTDKNLLVGALRGAKIFYLDDYGADPSGVSSSDTAFTNCYTDAVAALLTHSGAMIVLGAGTYLFSVNKVAVKDSRIGFIGQGKAATMINTTGNMGTMLQFNALSGGPGHSAAPIGYFTAYGWNAGNSVNGVEYGDRGNGFLVDVTATGFGGTSSRGFWFHDTTGLSEGSYMVLNADQNTINYDFDTSGGGVGSFDYSTFFLHLVATTAGGSSAIGLRFSAGQHCYGGRIHLAGNASATTGLTTTVVQVGTSTTDTARIQATNLQVAVEADTSAGTVKDLVVQGGANSGILQCHGEMAFLNAGGTYTAGSVGATGCAVKGWGYFTGPLFSGHGTLTALGGAGCGLYTYSG